MTRIFLDAFPDMKEVFRRNADANLYEAKEGGRNQIVCK